MGIYAYQCIVYTFTLVEYNNYQHDSIYSKCRVHTSELGRVLECDIGGAVNELVLIGQTDRTVLSKVSHTLQKLIRGDAHVSNGRRLT